MTVVNQNFTMFSGDTKDIKVTNLSGSSYEGSTIKWALKYNGSQVVSKTTSNGITISGSTFTIRLNSADTASLVGKCYHEAEVTDILGNVSTSMTGYITFERSNV